MGYYDADETKQTILKLLKDDAVQNPNAVVLKDMREYVMLYVPMINSKKYDTYRVYFLLDGRIDCIIGDSTNIGFIGVFCPS